MKGQRASRNGRRSVEKPTPDDWYPSINVHYVKLSTMSLSDGKFRVCVWGGDDFGMERDYATKAEADAAYDTLAKAAFISQRMCREMGFIQA